MNNEELYEQEEHNENVDATSSDDQEIAEGTEVNEVEALTAQLEAAQDKYTRLMAEFENYKRRTSREKVEIIQSAGKEVIGKLLPVLDDFDRAIIALETAQDVESVKQGVDLVHSKLIKILEQQGLKEMEVKGETFDSEFQEAITAIQAPSEELKNKVVDVLEKGYTLNDKVIRFAKVVIGK